MLRAKPEEDDAHTIYNSLKRIYFFSPKATLSRTNAPHQSLHTQLDTARVLAFVRHHASIGVVRRMPIFRGR
jgi:hypothetical protein